MIKVDQTDFGSKGNCMSACLASVFELDITDVPNFFVVGGEDAENWWTACRSWLRQRGFGVMSLQVTAETLSQFEGIFVVCGKSPRGTEHAVVFQNGKVIHDPHPDRGGVVEVTAVDMLYPLDPSKFKLK